MGAVKIEKKVRKRWGTGVKRWFKRWLAQAILLSLILFFAGKGLISYYTPFRFEMEEVIGDRGRAFSPSAFLRIYFSTDQATLPYEPIKAKIFFWPNSARWTDYMRDTAKSVFIAFVGAHLTKSKVNGKIVSRDYNTLSCQNLPQNLADIFADQDGAMVHLDKCPENDSLFIGEAEIYYGDPGDHLIVFNTGNSNLTLSTKLQIGSSVDLNSKKTNDVIYILTALNLIFILYTEFFKNRSRQS